MSGKQRKSVRHRWEENPKAASWGADLRCKRCGMTAFSEDTAWGHVEGLGVRGGGLGECDGEEEG